MHILLIVLAILAGILVLWFAASYVFMREKRILFSEYYQYETDLYRRFKLPDWTDLREFEYSALDVGNGVVLALYVLKGAPGSPVVVFMPGTAVYAQIYSNYMFSLWRRGFTVVGYDPRGHGESGRLRGYFTLAELVEDARKVCAYAKQRFGTRVGFTGSSQGGVTALYLAATGDRNVDTVVCHNFAVCYGELALEISVFKPPLWLLPFMVWLFKRMRLFVLPVSFYLPFNKLKLPDGQPAAPLLEADPMATLSYSLGAVASLADTKLPMPLERIRTPVMLVSSTKDEVFPVAYEQKLFDRLGCEKEFLLIPDKYHMMIIFDADKPWLIDPIAAWFHRHLDAAALMG
jgi:pimeloyl-ACP methyl ester carboxylesterase